MKRIVLFIATNIAIVFVLSVTMQLLGVPSLLAQNGVDLNLQALLVFASVLGFGGAFLSLLISKWSAVHLTGARVIKEPASATDVWLKNVVARQAEAAGISMPDVAIYEAPEINAFATGANRNAALVAVSTGLLHKLERHEVEAVLGHEVSHVANGDMVTMALLQGC